MQLRVAFRLGLLPVLGMLSGCASPGSGLRVEGGGPLPAADLKALYERAQDPRRHFITLRGTESGPEFDGAHRLYANQVDVLPFESPKGSPIPLVLMRGDSLRDVIALVDTTSAENWCDLQTAQAMKLAPMGPPALGAQPVHVNDPAHGFLCISDRINLRAIRVETALFFVRNWRGPLEALDRGIAKPHPGCVLGMRFLRPFAFARFDFPGRTLTLASGQPYTPSPARLVASVPYLAEAGALTVEGHLDGAGVSVVLDSAGQYALSTPHPTAEPVQLTLGDWPLEPQIATDAVTVGVSLERPVHLGLGFLSQYVMTIDLQQRVVHFELPAP